MLQALGHKDKYIAIPDINSEGLHGSSREMKHKVNHSIKNLEYENSFITKPVLRPEHGTSVEHISILKQGLHRFYLFYSVTITKRNCHCHQIVTRVTQTQSFHSQQYAF